VRAMVGGRDFHETRFNRATQARRQPGSAFKPLLFAAALERGYSPGTVVDNLTNRIAASGGLWLPADGHNQDAGYTLRRALTVSSNRAAAQLMQAVGVYPTIDSAKRLGITSALPAVPSLALGTGEVTLLELTSAYSAFANQGMRADPIFVRRVEDGSGTVLWQTRVTTTRAVSPETAFLMSSMLTDVVQRGTASKARSLGFTLPAAGKTGTTDDFQDAWFIGYTPHLVAGVWFGFDAPSRIMNEGFAATVAVPAWTAFMKRATANDKPDKFQPPPGISRVTLCRLSGKLATDACRAPADHTADLLAAIESGIDPLNAPRPARPSGVYEEYIVTGSVGPCELHSGAATAPIGASDRSTQTIR
jgi:membrane carboxypeptidase/penicillin-binding protein